ncbi:hypothetical protein [Thalassotalea sp. SU-HH00458]|uniref:hypothetical protein n=1 Tax=Thalassotalea sp. SU-HH00458 TaxID=3127657 RepID=UPI003104B368
METQLPISIKVNSLLTEKFTTLNSIANRLESQLNFQTMTAGWYGDEENILSLYFSIETAESFREISSNYPAIKDELADDVLYATEQNNQFQTCFVAITEIEHHLLDEHPKLMAGLLEKKLYKVLNMIGKKLKFNEL